MTKQADNNIDGSSMPGGCEGTDAQWAPGSHDLLFVSVNSGAYKTEHDDPKTEYPETENPASKNPEADHFETGYPETESIEEKWEKAGIGNAFIFGKVMSGNRGLLLELLQLSLPEFEITELVEPAKEVALKASYDSKGVRLDIRVLDIRGRVFNVEMQLRDEKNIPRRIRFYSSTLDTTILKTGEDYNQLGDSVVLFITTFDPFNRNRYRYTFRNICVEDRELELGDGTSKIILNASACSPEKKKGKPKPALLRCQGKPICRWKRICQEKRFPTSLEDSCGLSWERSRRKVPIHLPAGFRKAWRSQRGTAPRGGNS